MGKEETSEKRTFEQVNTSNYWEAAVLSGHPVAIWRLPLEQDTTMIISFGAPDTLINPDLDTLSKGFIISPFTADDARPTCFIKADITAKISCSGEISSTDFHAGEEHPATRNFLSVLNGVDTTGKAISCTPSPYPATDDSEERLLYQRKVEIALSAIKNKQLSKVVLSRRKEIQLPENFCPLSSFFKLADAYPSAFVSLFHLPDERETWLGASPELLVGNDTSGRFRTVALAGTQRAFDATGQLIPKYSIRWGQKEIEEQALVSRYIIECFKKIRLREYIESGPKTILAGNLYHLKTDFEVDTNALNFKELATTMLRLLHPTSAVCGTPKEEALRLINQVEGYDRSLYSGYLGPVNVDHRTDLFVNLRTMRIKNGKAHLYAGGGITEDSDPEAEWDETELKCETLLNTLL